MYKKHITLAKNCKLRERVISLGGISKGYGMTGWRIGYAYGPKEIIQQMVKIHQYTLICPTTISQYMALNLMKHKNNSVDIAKLKLNKQYAMQIMRESGLKYVESDGTFYIFASIEDTTISNSVEFCTKLLLEENVAIVPGEAFGKDWERFIRISYGCKREDLEIGMQKLKNFVSKLNNTQKK